MSISVNALDLMDEVNARRMQLEKMVLDRQLMLLFALQKLGGSMEMTTAELVEVDANAWEMVQWVDMESGAVHVRLRERKPPPVVDRTPP